MSQPRSVTKKRRPLSEEHLHGCRSSRGIPITLKKSPMEKCTSIIAMATSINGANIMTVKKSITMIQKNADAITSATKKKQSKAEAGIEPTYKDLQSSA